MFPVTSLPFLALTWLWITLAVITLIIIILFIVLTIVGRKLQKKNDAAMAEMKAAARPASMLVIDKKRMPLRDVGPQILSLMCDEKIFDLIPVKKECKAMISGIYIMEVRGLRGVLTKDEPKKKGLFARLRRK